MDDYVGTLNIFKILFHWIVTSVSRALLGFSIIYCYVSILRTFEIVCSVCAFRARSCWIVTEVVRALLGFSFTESLRFYYLTPFQDSLFRFYVREILEFYIIGLLR